MVLSYLLLVVIVLLLPKILEGKDISHNKYFWILSFPCGYIFLLFVSAWVKKSYRKTLQQAEEVLREVGT
ncbi:MAG TPA: hypothetical protein VM802_10275 [Chitinophaga sp.]|nr:hypothetical protein [Chitinophaga sp.]